MKRFFPEVLAIEALRKLFHEFCIKLHPDKGGNQADFIAMKDEYDAVIKLAAATEAGTATAENRKTRFDYEGEKVWIDGLERFIRLQGIIIEICGSWIWITGDTFPVHEQLSAFGARWSKQKKSWYYSPYMNSGHCKGHYRNLDAIRARFGSTIIENEEGQRTLSMAA